MQREVRLLLQFLGIPFSELDEVLARTKGLGSGAGNDGDAQSGFAVEPIEDAVEVPVVWEGDGVHLLGAVECDKEDGGGGVGNEDGGARRGWGEGGGGSCWVGHSLGVSSVLRDVLIEGMNWLGWSSEGEPISGDCDDAGMLAAR